jgi:membrane protein DedA with SNARE-associated domain
VLGAFLAATGALRPLEVFLATAAGSLVGSAAVYYIGRAAGFGVLYAGRNNRVLGRMLPPARVEGVLAAVRRFGPWIVAVNRFVPAVRMLFLLAAGAARVRPALALALAALSAILWNAVLFTVGYSAGTRLDLLQAAYERHRAAWALAVLAAAALALALALRRRHRAREGRA